MMEPYTRKKEDMHDCGFYPHFFQSTGKFKKFNIEYKDLSMEDRNPAITAIVVMIFGQKVCPGRRMK